MAHDGHIYDLGEGSDLAQTGDVAVAQRDDGLVSLEAGRARILDRNPPAGFALLAVDARQRVLGLDHGKLVRRSPDGHWDVLLTAPVDTTE
jgi:hypothetical protein